MKIYLCFVHRMFLGPLSSRLSHPLLSSQLVFIPCFVISKIIEKLHSVQVGEMSFQEKLWDTKSSEEAKHVANTLSSLQRMISKYLHWLVWLPLHISSEWRQEFKWLLAAICTTRERALACVWTSVSSHTDKKDRIWLTGENYKLSDQIIWVVTMWSEWKGLFYTMKRRATLVSPESHLGGIGMFRMRGD